MFEMVANHVSDGTNFQIVATVLINDSTKLSHGAVTTLPGHAGANGSVDFNVDEFLSENFGEKRKDLPSVVILTIVYTVIFLTGVIGNLSTCIVITKNSYLHSATNYYLFSLAVSDMVTLLLGLPPELYSIWEAYPWRFGEVFCIFKSFLSEMTSYASVLTITAFTVERYVAICHPIKAQTLSNLSRAIRIIIVIWILACACALPYPVHTRVFYYFDYPNSTKPIEESMQCNIPLAWLDFMKHMFQVSFYVFFVLPMGIITIMYVMIGLALKKSQFGGSATELCFKNNAKASARKAVIKMLVAVVVAFFVCWAPFHAQRLMTSYVSRDLWTRDLLDFQSHLFYISGVLYFFNSTVNPILYNLMSRKFRRAFKRTLCRCFYTKEELAELRGTSRSVLYSERTQCVSKFRDSSPIHFKGINGTMRRTKSGSTLTPGPSPRAARLLLNGYMDRRPQSMMQNGRRVLSSAGGLQIMAGSIPASPNISPAASVASFDGLEMDCRRMDDNSRSTSRSVSPAVSLLVKCTNMKHRDTTFV